MSWSGVLAGCWVRRYPVQTTPSDTIPNGAVIVGTRASSQAVSQHIPAADLAAVGNEGYIVRSVTSGATKFTVIAGNTEVGALYGTFAFLRLHADAEADHEPEPLRVAQDQEPPSGQLGRHAPVRRQQRGRNRRAERRERDDLQLRRHRRQRRPEPARDPRPLHRGGAGARVGGDQRLRDQPRQRQQRLPDERVHRAGSGAGRRAASVRDQALRWPSTTRRRPTRRFAPGHADQPAAGSLQRRVPGLVDAQGHAAPGVDPGFHGLHRQGQLRRPAGSAGLRLRPR